MTELPPALPSSGDNPWASQQPPPGAYGGYYPPPVQPVRSVRGLGIATQVMLAVHFVATVALLFPALHERSLINDIFDNPDSVTSAEVDDADRTLNALSVTSTLLYIATGIVWIVWFYRARKNVNAWEPQFQRRSRGWAIGGWFCPVVNLWFPAMIAKDILDDTERDPAEYHSIGPSRPLVVVWGIGFALMIVSGFVLRLAARSLSNSYLPSADDFRFYVNAVVGNIVITMLAAVPAFLLVRQITSAQELRMRRPVTASGT